MLIVVAMKPDIVCINETWLNSNIEDHLVCIKGYQLIRQDRHCKKGRGTCFFLNNLLDFEVLHLNITLNNQISCLPIFVPYYNALFIAIYIPPNINSKDHTIITDTIIDCCDLLLNFKPSASVYFMGDIN